MSKIMEKTFASLPKLLVQGFSSGTGPKMPPANEINPEVMNFMKAVHRTRSKSSEASIVLAELSALEKKMKQDDQMSSSALRTCFSKAIFCYLLGYDITFVAIAAMKLANSGQGYDKKLGYLVASLILHPEHNITILMTATILKDLKSANMGDNFVALTTAAALASHESIPFFLPEVVVKMNHAHELVREKALHCLHTFYLRAPALLQNTMSKIGSSLSSRDPGVLTATVNIFLSLCEKNPSLYVGFGESMLHILHQINNRGFGASYYHHMVPLPWLQISLLKVLGLLARVDQELCESLTPLLKSLIEKTKVTEPISLALLVESILTSTKIAAGEELLELSSRCIAKLLALEASADMRYQGLGLLIALSRVKPAYAARHQSAVVACLGDSDPAIQQRTTELLHSMANGANVKAICSKLFQQIDNSTDPKFTCEIFVMIADLVEKFPIDLHWYIMTYLNILQHKKLTDSTSFMESVLSRVSMLRSPSSEGVVSENVLDILYQTLENTASTPTALSLSISLFGVLAPHLNGLLSSERLLSAFEKFLFSPTRFNGQPQRMKILSPPSSRKNKALGSCNDGNDMKHFSDCIETLIRLVLSGALAPEAVAVWLENNKQRQIRTTLAFCCDMQDLEDLVKAPQNLQLRSAVMFGSTEDCVDLSLSFLDTLVVQSYLQGEEVLKPQYVLMSEKIKDDESLGSKGIETKLFSVISDVDVNSNKQDPLPTMTDSQVSTKIKSKWQEEEDEEELLNIDMNASNFDAQSELDMKGSQKHQMALELFAGLTFDTTDNSSNASHDKSKPQGIKPKSSKSLWDSDDESEEGSSIPGLGKLVEGLHLNPFGFSKKPKSHPSSGRWKDDSTLEGAETEADSCEADFFSSQVEKIATPQFAMSQSEHYQMFSSFTNPSSTHIPHQSKSNLSQSLNGSLGTVDSGLGSREESGGVSIYSEYSEAKEMSSTVDTLTDSEPEDIITST